MKPYILIEKYTGRKCTSCLDIFPSTNSFFQRRPNKNVKFIFRSACKKCLRKQTKEWEINNKEHRKKYYKQYCIENKDSINKNKREYKSKRKKSDSLYNATVSIRNAIKSSLRKKTFPKNSRTHEILGCTFEEFKIHIERQFLSWMNWNNYGKYNGELNFGWDFDHIISVDSAQTYEELIKLNHYTNFQPLCSKINRDIKR
ncbi:MAG TPA: hypothetical protein VNX68_02825 [Nitrosopumilaceae archaeon]|jgi:hypothetical protein|nr:hypothetical protein [Nitrosopumilaceae archaeon]